MKSLLNKQRITGVQTIWIPVLEEGGKALVGSNLSGTTYEKAYRELVSYVKASDGISEVTPEYLLEKGWTIAAFDLHHNPKATQDPKGPQAIASNSP